MIDNGHVTIARSLGGPCVQGLCGRSGVRGRRNRPPAARPRGDGAGARGASAHRAGAGASAAARAEGTADTAARHGHDGARGCRSCLCVRCVARNGALLTARPLFHDAGERGVGGGGGGGSGGGGEAARERTAGESHGCAFERLETVSVGVVCMHVAACVRASLFACEIRLFRAPVLPPCAAAAFQRACVRACVRAPPDGDYVRACVCACVRACVSACVRACMCMCLCLGTDSRGGMHVHVFVFGDGLAWRHACACVCVWGRTCVAAVGAHGGRADRVSVEPGEEEGDGRGAGSALVLGAS